MKILIYAGIYPKSGTGHLLRSFHLYRYLKTCNEVEHVFFSSNDPDLLKKVLANLGEESHQEKTTSEYDLVILDTPFISRSEISEFRQMGRVLFALDFFDYEDTSVDVAINLMNRNVTELYKFKGIVFEGLDYTIISDDILQKRSACPKFDHQRPKVLVSFGGEDPKSLTYSVLQKLDPCLFEITAIVGVLNSDYQLITDSFSTHGVTILNFTPQIGELMATSDIVICGGGTTMLEALYLGNPLIALPQNIFEENFINYIRKEAPVFSIDNITELYNCFHKPAFREKIRREYSALVDGQGKKRIAEILFNHVNL
ncbi:MAG: glycosyltransferase [Syntrophomonas sp.]